MAQGARLPYILRMSESRMFSPAYSAEAQAGATTSYAALLGQVMFLVALAIGFLALGSYVGRDLSIGTARILSFAGFGMLIATSFAGAVFRTGPVAIFWLFATSLVIGLGLGPVLAYYVANDASAVTQAAGVTALVVLGMGAAGTFMAKDLARWMRPLSLVVLGLVLVSFVMVLFSSGGNPILSAAIGLRLGGADRGRLQLPAQARDRGRRRPAGDRDLRLDRQHLPVAAQPVRAIARARSSTASSIAGVSRPVNVFCWLGWKQPTSVSAAGRRLGAVAEARPRAPRPGRARARRRPSRTRRGRRRRAARSSSASSRCRYGAHVSRSAGVGLLAGGAQRTAAVT